MPFLFLLGWDRCSELGQQTGQYIPAYTCNACVAVVYSIVIVNDSSCLFHDYDGGLSVHSTVLSRRKLSQHSLRLI